MIKHATLVNSKKTKGGRKTEKGGVRTAVLSLFLSVILAASLVLAPLGAFFLAGSSPVSVAYAEEANSDDSATPAEDNAGDILPLAETLLPLQVNNTANINTVSDTSPDGSARHFDYKQSTWSGTSGNGQDPAGGNYYQLAIDATNQYTWWSAPQKVSSSVDWGLTGYFSPNRIRPDGSLDSGDFIAINVYSGDADPQATKSASGGGGGLGLVGNVNAFGLGIDQYRNGGTPYYDPAPGPFGYFRWSGGGGSTLPDTSSYNKLYTNSGSTSYPDMTQWSLPIKYTFDYHYNGGSPYITGGLDDGYGRTWTFDTRNSGAGGGIGIDPSSSGYYQVALISGNGNSHQNWRGSYDRFYGDNPPLDATIHHVLNGTNDQQIAPNTTLRAGEGQKVGITGVSSGAIAGTDTFAYNAAMPTNADTAYRNGYHAVRTWSYGSGAQDLTFSTTTTKNDLYIYYGPDVQQARLVTGNSDPQGWHFIQTITGSTGGQMTTWTATDADLARDGYNYTVLAPNGLSYPTFAAAKAAVTTYDATNNGTATNDSAPQDFTVNYTRSFEQAIVKAVQNGTTTTIATYDNTTNASTGTPNRPLEDGTSGNLKANVQDPALAKPGYTYTVTGPNNQTYATMQAAWNATNAWDLTTNPAGATSDSVPQVWTVNYTGQTQQARLEQVSPAGSGGPSNSNKETASGPSATKITFSTTDSQLATTGYTYTVDAYDGAGTKINTYNTLQAALTANPNYDANAVSAGGSDLQVQRFVANYSPTNQKVTYHYQDARNNVQLRGDTTGSQPTGAEIDVSNPPTIQGYVYSRVDSSRPDSDTDMKVNGDGSSVIYHMYVVDPDIITAANTANTNATNSPVYNESAVQAAETNLNKVLSDPNSSPQQIQDATKALNDAVAKETTARDNAKNDAASATNNANNSTVKDDQSVKNAQDNLNSVLNNPASTTQQIKDATTELNNAVSTAQAAQANKDAANAAANAAKDPANTSPVTHEPGVQTAIDTLNQVQNNPASTAQDINDATSALTTAVADATTDRSTANTAAENEKTAAQNSAAKNDLRVQEALNNLQQLQNAAAADSAASSTQQINEAAQALKDAVAASETDKTTAQNDANTALASTAPVSNEAAVAQAKNDLLTVLSDPNATAAQIKEKTDALTNEVASANQARTDAKSAAQAAIDKAKAAPDYSTDQATQDAVTDLQNTIAQANGDSSNALTQTIIDKTTALNTASAASDTGHTQARDDAGKALTQTAPVSNEAASATGDVVSARNNLQSVLNNTASTTAELQAATQALRDAVAQAQTGRDAAKGRANSAIQTAQNDASISGDPLVKQAIANLQNIMTQADADSASALTKDIELLKDALNTAVSDAQLAKSDAMNKAQQALDGASPVSNEPGLPSQAQAIRDAMADPQTTADQLNALTNAYNTRVDSEKSERQNAVDAADTALADVSNSSVKNEPAVTQALQDLQDTMTKAANNDATALTQDIEDKTAALKQTQKDAQALRDTAVNNANTAKTDATTSTVGNEQSVKDAQTALDTVLSNPDATTQDIANATEALNNAVTAAETDRQTALDNANAASAAAQNSSNPAVYNEKPVYDADNTLHNVLNDPASTTQQIKEATDALNNAVSAADANRQTAKDEAQQAINDAKAAPTGSQPAVQDAINNLQQVKDSPTSTTQDIKDAITQLDNTVANADRDRQAAKDAATAAQDPSTTSPVSSEPTVATAKNDLNAVLNSPNSTTQDIVDATQAFNTAVSDAKTERTTAADEGNSLNSSTVSTSVGQEPSVVAAMDHLNDVIEQSKSDTPNALTDDIKTAMQQVKDAAGAAQTARDNAKQAIANADSSQVANEQPVKDAKQELQNVLNNPQSTNQQVVVATNNLKTAQQQEQAKRDNAITDANAKIDEANADQNSDAQSVIDAKNNLEQVLSNPNSTTTSIQDATSKLDTAVEEARTDRDLAVDAANTARGSSFSSPVSNEPEVVAASQSLDNRISDQNSSTDDIEQETANYEQVVAAAKTQRDNAVAAANDTMTEVFSSNVGQDPDVVAAQNRLQQVVTDAANDNPNALTADVLAARQALIDAQKKAQDALIVGQPPAQPPAESNTSARVPTTGDTVMLDPLVWLGIASLLLGIAFIATAAASKARRNRARLARGATPPTYRLLHHNKEE